MEVGKGGRKKVCQMLVLLVYLQSQGRWVKARGLENSHITGRQTEINVSQVFLQGKRPKLLTEEIHYCTLMCITLCALLARMNVVGNAVVVSLTHGHRTA